MRGRPRVGKRRVDERERKDAAKRDARNAAALRRNGLSAFMDAWECLPLFATQRDLSASTCERVRAGRLANDAEALARTFEHAGQHAMPARRDVLVALASLRDSGVPVRYIAGARDVKYRALAKDLEDEGLCEVRVVAGAGHNVHLEEPAAYLRAFPNSIAPLRGRLRIGRKGADASGDGGGRCGPLRTAIIRASRTQKRAP